jgi:tetratricopeptide (TPR) repeat protein
MRIFRNSITAYSLLAVSLIPFPVQACTWDHDTLQQERARFPTAIELITGKFLRHSKEFYEWRIKDCLQKLAVDSRDVAAYDDLGVAYQKVGQHGKALEAMREKEKISPGLYETEANLGTFYILSGDLDQGLKHIDKALEINPHAHFDRERYQKWLVEYAISRRKNGKICFPLRSSKAKDRTFAEFIYHKLGLKEPYEHMPFPFSERLPVGESQKAVHAVLGMMRFADYDNPLLQEALGDLLIFTNSEDGKRLATRAYLAASYKFKGRKEEQDFRQFAIYSIRMQTENAFSTKQLELSELEADFRKEIAAAEQWYSRLKHDECSWIRQGLNADAEFDKLYTKEPEVVDKNVVPLIGALPIDFSIFRFWFYVSLIGVLGLVLTARIISGWMSHGTDSQRASK